MFGCGSCVCLAVCYCYLLAACIVVFSWPFVLLLVGLCIFDGGPRAILLVFRVFFVGVQCVIFLVWLFVLLLVGWCDCYRLVVCIVVVCPE